MPPPTIWSTRCSRSSSWSAASPGAQFGARAGQKIRSEQLRLLLGLLVLAVGLRFAYDLVVPPDELFSMRLLEGTR